MRKIMRLDLEHRDAAMLSSFMSVGAALVDTARLMQAGNTAGAEASAANMNQLLAAIQDDMRRGYYSMAYYTAFSIQFEQLARATFPSVDVYTKGRVNG